jgi:hypothetical protein
MQLPVVCRRGCGCVRSQALLLLLLVHWPVEQTAEGLVL